MKNFKKLGPDKLKRYWDVSKLPFKTTQELKPLNGIMGQKRAIKAMEFGSTIHMQGYNLFLSGMSGTGKTSYAQKYMEEIAKHREAPYDWCYVYDFENPSSPVAIKLPSGKGRELQQDIEELMEDLKIEISKSFSGQDYENETALLFKELQENRNKIFNKFTEYAKEQGFQVNNSNAGLYFSPLIDGKPLEEEEYNQLDDKIKENINNLLAHLQLQAVVFMRKIKELEKETKIKVKDLEHRIGLFAVGIHIEDLKEKYKQYPKIERYLIDLMQDVLENIDDFKETDIDRESEVNPLIHIFKRNRKGIQNKYNINLLVDNSDTKGAPVIIEYNPTYCTLFGSLEYENRLGTVATDFTMIKPGSIHRANGGYLILQAKDILSVPFMWEGLKKVLKTSTICIENLREQFGLMAISTLEPEPIPVQLKVVLVGSNYLYQLLYQLDEDFPKLFKIKVDFDDEMEANQDNLISLARYISGFCHRNNICHFTNKAVIRIAQYSSRLVENQEKLSTRFNEVTEILAEANTWARIAGKNLVTEAEVIKAIEEKEYRSNKYDQKLMDLLENETIMLDTKGAKIGQINGLSILDTGDFVFGKPAKITVTTYVGERGIVNIEREVDMSGTSHSKGVMILSGYIGEQYVQENPLALNANITFEQLYGTVDGDSASSTELYAILSSLAEVPIDQGIAVTGSVNQKGEIQPVGGVTHKIEGFFNLCKLKGLTGKQGVIIPQQNIRNIVLKDEVIKAVKEGDFHIYPIQTIEEGIEILTGIPAGQKLENGFYEKGSIHEKVYNKIRDYALIIANFGKEDKDI